MVPPSSPLAAYLRTGIASWNGSSWFARSSSVPAAASAVDRAVDALGQGAALGEDDDVLLGRPLVELADRLGAFDLDVRDVVRGREVDDERLDLLGLEAATASSFVL